MKTRIALFIKRTIVWVFLISVSALPLAARPFFINFDTAPSTLDPHTGQPGTDHNYFKQMFEPLVEIDVNGNPVPSLAVSWESKDLKTWTFKLRQGVRFHDGTPFNAAAVKFNIQRLQDPATKSKVQGIAKKILGIEILDNYTIRLTLDKPNVDFPIVLQDRPGMIVSPAAVKKYGKDFGRKPVGTGPFVFKSWKTGDSVTMKQNPHYWAKERVFLDDVVIKIVPDRNVAGMNLQAGKADLMVNVAPEHAARMKMDRKLRLYSRSALEFTCIYLRLKSSPQMGNKEVRQALAYVIDKDAISKALYFGTASSASGLLPAGFWAYEPDVTDYAAQNITKAKALLQKAGYPNGFEAKYTTIPAFPFNKVAQIVKQQASEIGIVLNIEMMGLGQAIQTSMMNKTDILGLGWSGRTSTDATFQSLVHSTGTYNGKSYSNAEVDRLLEMAKSTQDTDTRKRAYSRVQQILAEDLPLIPILHMPMFYAAKKEVSGIKLYIDLKLRLLDVKAN